MPVLIQPHTPQKHRVPVWLLVLAVMNFPLVGVFTWSCFQEIQFGYPIEKPSLGFGYGRNQDWGNGVWNADGREGLIGSSSRGGEGDSCL